MQIVEVKNNLVKLSFDASVENVILSNFLIVKDSVKSFIAQIVYIEANLKGNFAIAKLLFTFDSNGVVSDYNGAVPDIKQNQVIPVETQEFLYLLPSKRKIFLGEIAQQKTELILDRNILEQKLLICSEHVEDKNLTFKNINSQLVLKGQKVVIFDKTGDLDIAPKITASENFKIPLNYDTIDFIYKKGLDDANAESKAIIQDVFLEVQNYVKTLPDNFLPFETFKNVVDEQYKELGIVQLVLLKNKLLKYKEHGIFAQNKEEFRILEKSLEENSTVVIDISKLNDIFQREYMSYVISVLNDNKSQNYYTLFNLEDANSDKKLLKQIYSTKNIYPSITVSYDYKYLTELKQLSNNMLLFTPIQQQHDFASYNVMLNKLNNQEFIVFGKETHFVPLIVKLSELPQQKIYEDEKEPRIEQQQEEQEISTPKEQTQTEEVKNTEAQEEITQPVKEEPKDFIETVEPKQENSTAETISQPQIQPNEIDEETNQQIIKDVDEIYTHPKSQSENTNEEIKTNADGEFTEEDLDFIQGLNDETDETEKDEDFSSEVLPDETDNNNDEDIIFDDIVEDETINTEQDSKENVQDFEPVIEENFTPQTQSEEEINEEQQPQANTEDDIIPVSESEGSILPIYNAETSVNENVSADDFLKGDNVTHPKYGNGVIEKIISYGNKKLCSINFENVGRRLLDPTLADIKKI